MPNINPLNNRSAEQSLLTKHVALVTGSSRGIGKAIALKLAAIGSSIAACGRDANALAQTERELKELGVATLVKVADVTKAQDVSALVDATQQKLGPITVLVNNAGMGLFGPAHEKSEEEWDRLMNTNLKSVFLVSKAVAPSMIQRKAGDIVNISSLAGKNTFAGGGIYCASKWGLMGLTGCMAEDLRSFGIRVTAICPGSVATEFAGRGPKDASKVLTAQDVAHAVAMVLLQGPQSFISEVDLRPLAKPGK